MGDVGRTFISEDLFSTQNALILGRNCDLCYICKDRLIWVQLEKDFVKKFLELRFIATDRLMILGAEKFSVSM